MGARCFTEGDGFTAPYQGIHPFLGFGRYHGRLAQDQGENLMARCNLGQMHVRLQAQLFYLGNLFGGQHIIKVLCHRVGSKALGPVAGGVVMRRRRVTCLMRAINSWAVSLSATFWPIVLISKGSRVSSR